ncbi:MAG TPA: hypothetical protein VEL76_33730 [Gemmataceae bacterium]|nr:hypothetical protein [Gemmataceae bacterium]
MTAQCLLDAGGYQVTFAFHNGRASREYLDAVVELSLPAELGAVAVKSQPTFIAVKDLQRLAAYLGEHVAALQRDPDRDAPLFVPLELGFQLQALSGDVDSDNDGEFTLRFMINVGQPAEGSRVYVGAESTVEVVRIREFIASLEGIASESSRSR